jgi:hypothetical protein
MGLLAILPRSPELCEFRRAGPGTSLIEERQADVLQHKLPHELDDLVDWHLCVKARGEILSVRVVLVLIGFADHANRIPSTKHRTHFVVRGDSARVEVICVTPH